MNSSKETSSQQPSTMPNDLNLPHYVDSKTFWSIIRSMFKRTSNTKLSCGDSLADSDFNKPTNQFYDYLNHSYTHCFSKFSQTLNWYYLLDQTKFARIKVPLSSPKLFSLSIQTSSSLNYWVVLNCSNSQEEICYDQEISILSLLRKLLRRHI